MTFPKNVANVLASWQALFGIVGGLRLWQAERLFRHPFIPLDHVLVHSPYIGHDIKLSSTGVNKQVDIVLGSPLAFGPS